MGKARRLMGCGRFAYQAGMFILWVFCSNPVEADRILTNMDVLEEATRQAIREGIQAFDGGPEEGRSVVLSAAREHEGNWFVESLLLDALTERGSRVYLDSTGAKAAADTLHRRTPRLSYQIIALQVSYLGQHRQGLFGESVVERSTQVELSLEIVDDSGRIVSLNQSKGRVRDRFPADRLSTVEQPSYPFARNTLDRKSWTRFLEPVIVSAVVGMLLWILYSSR